jgi:hypothetical protein
VHAVGVTVTTLVEVLVAPGTVDVAAGLVLVATGVPDAGGTLFVGEAAGDVAEAVAVEVEVEVAGGTVGDPQTPGVKISMLESGVTPSTSYPPASQMVDPSVSTEKLRRAFMNGVPTVQESVPGS